MQVWDLIRYKNMTTHNEEIDDYVNFKKEQLTHIVFLFNFKKLQKSDVLIGKYEACRIELQDSDKTINNRVLKIAYNIPANFKCDETNVTAVTSNTNNTQFTVANSGFLEFPDFLIEVELESGETFDREVKNISGNTVTIGEPLTSNPVKIRSKLSQKCLIADGNINANSGSLRHSFEERMNKLEENIVPGVIYLDYDGN